MYSCVTRKLPTLVEEHFPASPGVRCIFEHSMDGPGTLTIPLKTPTSTAAFLPSPPSPPQGHIPWGEKAFSCYLGEGREAWREHDASELVREAPLPDVRTILVNQGDIDQFLEEQLSPGVFERACAEAGQPLDFRWHEGYDHGYYSISTFVEDHVRHHAATLGPFPPHESHGGKGRGNATSPCCSARKLAS